MPSLEAERLFLESFINTRERFRQSLDALRAGRLHLANTDFDTGRPTTRGEYSLADATYDELLDKLAGHAFADVPAPLSANLISYYGTADPPGDTAGQLKRLTRNRLHLASLKAACLCP